MATTCCFTTCHAVLRCLGIPSRPLSNFASAHDTEANRSIDYYYDENYYPISYISADSIWWALLCGRLYVHIYHVDSCNTHTVPSLYCVLKAGGCKHLRLHLQHMHLLCSVLVFFRQRFLALKKTRALW